jgi:accessory gene regulator B
MISKISILLSEEIGLKLNSSDNEMQVYAYSIEVLSSLLINLIILSITAHLLDKWLQLVTFIIFFSGLRIYAGGYHAKTHIECMSISFIIFTISALCSTYFKQFGEFILIFGILFSSLMIFVFAPSESDNKPLSNNERKKYKMISRITVIILSLAVVFLYFVKIQTDFIYITASVAMIIECFSLLVK